MRNYTFVVIVSYITSVARNSFRHELDSYNNLINAQLGNLQQVYYKDIHYKLPTSYFVINTSGKKVMYKICLWYTFFSF